MNLPHRLDRTVVIQAAPQTVFSFFTDSDRWASWWGAGSSIEPQAGGRVYIRHANGIESSGEVVEVEPPKRIVFDYGFNSGTPMPPGSSRVTILSNRTAPQPGSRSGTTLQKGVRATSTCRAGAISSPSLATSSPISSTPAPPTLPTRGLLYGRKRTRSGDGRW